MATIPGLTGNLPAGLKFGKPFSYPGLKGPLPGNLKFGDPFKNVDALAALKGEYSALQKQVSGLINQINSQPQAAIPNFSAINAQARRRAAKAVNPYYQKELQTFLTTQKIKKQRAKQDFKSTVADLATARARTGEDVATNLGEIANTEDVFQTQEGQAFDQARLTLAGDVAEAGLAGSGLGAQQQQQAVQQRNVESVQQQRSFNVQRQAQELFRTRTFEDISRQKTKAKIDVDRYVKDLARETIQGKRQTEKERLSAFAQEEARQRALGFQRFLRTINNPGVLAETARAFGGAF